MVLLLLLVTLASAPVALCQNGLLVIRHFDVGQADCTLLVSPSGKSALFDCGDANWNSSRELTRVAPRIAEFVGGKQLDYVVVSHFNVDHVGYVGYGGLWGLFETYGFRTRHLLIRDYVTYPDRSLGRSYELWSEYFGKTAAVLRLETPELGAVIDLGDGVTLTVCSVDGNGLLTPSPPTAECPTPENEFSLGILISFGAYQEWIGGDLGGTQSRRSFGLDCVGYADIETNACRWIGDIEVLRVDHHGSGYSSNAVFLANVDPEVSIISVGESRSYGHPDAGVLARLAQTSDVYITTQGNKDGAIMTRLFDLSAHANVHADVGDVVIETDGVYFWVNGTQYPATTPVRIDADGDGYFVEVDPDDTAAGIVPTANVVAASE